MAYLPKFYSSSVHELEAQIKSMQAEISKKIDYINNGGCIQFAYYFSKALKLNKIRHEITFMDYNYVYWTYGDFMPVSHVLIYIPKIGFIDGTYIFKDRKALRESNNETYVQKRYLSDKKLNHFRSTNYSWNPRYCRSQNYLLDKIITKHINGKRRNLCKK